MNLSCIFTEELEDSGEFISYLQKKAVNLLTFYNRQNNKLISYLQKIAVSLQKIAVNLQKISIHQLSTEDSREFISYLQKIAVILSVFNSRYSSVFISYLQKIPVQ